MKKLVLIMVVLFSFSCSNPSMDDGLARLEQSLAELGAAIEALNIPQMQADLENMNVMAEQMIVNAQEAQGAFDEALEDIAYINAMLDGIVADSELWATSEQMSALVEQTTEFNSDVQALVLAADYDHDGVINAIDKCPDTKLGATVDANGCAADQTPSN